MAGITSNDLVTSLEELTYANRDKNPVNQRGSSELGKEEFLKLLTCQMSNQDPLNPQEDADFIAQLAQFSALEQMTNMNQTLMNTSAYNLVGKEVLVSHTDSTGTTSETRGVVDYVEMKNGDAFLSIDGKTFSIDDLVKVMDSFYAIKEYLPSVEEQSFKVDKSQPSIIDIKLNLGSEGYEASSVAVSIDGEYIDKEYMKYDAEDGILRIMPGAFESTTPGTYQLGFYFNDPYNTSVTDKVTVQVVNGTSSSGNESSSGETETQE